ncbi:MAG: cysteine desulfurase [Lachnospira sp.]|nr:cysteine desulfurase [Lachnospira sp.]
MPSNYRTIYMDHAATTPVHPEVFYSMKPYLTSRYGNPSSAYHLGEYSAQAIAKAREQIAKVIHAHPSEIYFTGGGSESDNWALKGVVDYNRIRARQNRCHIMTTAIEHPAVLNSAVYLKEKGIEVDFLPVDREGRVNMKELMHKTKPQTVLLSVMYANNEIGTIEPIDALGDYAKLHNIIFHTDAVQAFGQVPIDVKKSQIDLLSASGHKLGGPKGVGFLYVRKNCPLEPFVHGGGQEQGKRSGTENVAGIVGLGKAAELASQNMEERRKRISAHRDMLAKLLLQQIRGSHINGAKGEERLPGNLNITLPGVNATELVAKLDEQGVLCSTASACSAHKSHASHVLTSIGLTEEEALSTIRLTLGEENTMKQIYYVAQLIPQMVKEMEEDAAR